MIAFKHALPALLLIMLAACSSHSTTQTSAAPGADGTLVVREKNVLRIANGGSGQGTLTFRGWEYPFEINNMALSGIGPGHIQLEGDVFNLNDTSDFAGTYNILAAEVEAGEGAQGFWFENENGVRVHIRTEGQDITIRLNTDGSIVTLK